MNLDAQTDGHPKSQKSMGNVLNVVCKLLTERPLMGVAGLQYVVKHADIVAVMGLINEPLRPNHSSPSTLCRC